MACCLLPVVCCPSFIVLYLSVAICCFLLKSLLPAEGGLPRGSPATSNKQQAKPSACRFKGPRVPPERWQIEGRRRASPACPRDALSAWGSAREIADLRRASLFALAADLRFKHGSSARKIADFSAGAQLERLQAGVSHLHRILTDLSAGAPPKKLRIEGDGRRPAWPRDCRLQRGISARKISELRAANIARRP